METAIRKRPFQIAFKNFDANFVRSYSRNRGVGIFFSGIINFLRGINVKRENPVGVLVRAPRAIRAIFFIFAAAAFAQSPEIPEVDGHLGACSTTVTVLDSESKPVYNAKVAVSLRYGFLGFRKMSLEVGTNSEGKARVAGLPENPKNPLEFEIASGRLSKKVLVDVKAKCSDSIQVMLGAQ